MGLDKLGLKTSENIDDGIDWLINHNFISDNARITFNNDNLLCELTDDNHEYLVIDLHIVLSKNDTQFSDKVSIVLNLHYFIDKVSNIVDITFTFSDYGTMYQCVLKTIDASQMKYGYRYKKHGIDFRGHIYKIAPTTYTIIPISPMVYYYEME